MAPWRNVWFLIWGRKYKMSLEDPKVPESKELLKRKKNEACKKNVGINLEELPMAGKLWATKHTDSILL